MITDIILILCGIVLAGLGGAAVKTGNRLIYAALSDNISGSSTAGKNITLGAVTFLSGCAAVVVGLWIAQPCLRDLLGTPDNDNAVIIISVALFSVAILIGDWLAGRSLKKKGL